MNWFGVSAKKRSKGQQSKANKAAIRALQQTFILEPLITPSGLVDGVEGAPDPLALDLHTPPLPDIHLPETDFDHIPEPEQLDTPVDIQHTSEVSSNLPHVSENTDPTDSNTLVSNTKTHTTNEVVNDTHPVVENTIETHSPIDGTIHNDVIAAHTLEVLVDDDQLEPLSFINSISDVDSHGVTTATANIDSTFTSGVFTVSAKGEVSFDYLFDGGNYQGQVAIFSLDGMDKFVPGSEEFIHEATSRALSDSNLGHVVVNDITDGARFSGVSSGMDDFNSGVYQGVKTYSMKPGDTFGVMLIPNSTVQQVFNGETWGSARPLFSMTMANPNEAFHVGQIADVNGNGNTFVMEDLRMDGVSDKDYNDIIFKIHGATGKAVHMDQVIDPGNDWRETELGGKLMEFIKPPVNQPLIGIIDTGLSASNLDVDPFHVHFGPHSDYVAGDGNPLLQVNEGSQHGTHVTGIIAADTHNAIGIDGVNDQAPIYVARATGSGHWAQALTDFVDAAKESGQPHAIANLSLDLTQANPDGSVTTRYELTPVERTALEYARQNGVVIVAAAGNDGGVMSALGQASQEFDNIITVGAAKQIDLPIPIDISDNRITLAGTSAIDVPANTNVTVSDGLHIADHPNTSIPVAKAFDRADYSSYGYGLDILADGGTNDNPVLSTVGDGVGTMSGTSVATAQVTGAASLVWASNPDLSYHQVIEILKSTATDLKAPGWDMETGAGLLNITAAVGLAKVTTPEPYAPETVGAIPTTWTGEGKVTPTERPAYSASEVGQQPTGGTYASGYIAPWKSSVQLTQDWNSNYSHNGNSAYAKDWVIADHKVYAAKAGKVVYVKQDSTRYGDSADYANDANYVIIRHDDGYESLYLHLKAGSVPVKVGDVVQAGTYIGETGLSGWTTGEHLHFVVRNPNTKQSVPFKLDGNINSPTPQPPPTSSGVWPTSFSAWVMATDGANVRSGPGTAYDKVGYFPYKTTIEFDAWTYGETITDVLSGKPDARWYRIKGTEKWVSSAIVYGNAPGSTPLPSNNPGTPTPPGYTVNGNFNSVWQQYKNTLGAPTSGVINHSSGATYQLFQNGSIVSSKYGTFPLYGGIRQTYLNTGGLDGWLGAPKSAEYSQGDGFIRQDFENGYIIWNGSKAIAYRTGTGTPVTPPPTPKPTQPKVNDVSADGLKFIAKYEGTSLKLYNDPAGHCTIGTGHLVHLGNCNGSEPAEFRAGITESRALELLKADVNTAVQAVNNLVKVPLNQNQFDALVSFAFNVGTGEKGFAGSDLLKKLNAGKYDEVPAELNYWIHGGGKVLPGLVTRRKDEGNLFRDGKY